MKSGEEFDLLIDITKLLKKYGPDAFERLAQQLASAEFVARVSALLSAAAKAAREVEQQANKPTPRVSATGDYRSSLVALAQTEPEKAALLLRLHDRLMAKQLLPTLQDLRSFTLESGLSVPASTSRPRAVIGLLEGLQALRLEELQQVCARIGPARDKDDRSLENWARIILDPNLKARRAN